MFIQKTHPGPQTTLFNFSWIFSILLSLILLFFVLTIYAIIQDNTLITSSYYRFFSIKILDSKTACTLMVTLIGLILVRHHFVVGFKPRIIYEAQKTKSSTSPYMNLGEVIWQVKIRNVGLGAALFLEYAYRVSLKEISDSSFELDYKSVRSSLKEAGFHSEEDFFLSNITSGFALQAKEEKVLFEMKLPQAIDLAQLDIKIVFKGFLGGKYQKEVFVIPRLGIYNKDLD